MQVEISKLYTESKSINKMIAKFNYCTYEFKTPVNQQATHFVNWVKISRKLGEWNFYGKALNNLYEKAFQSNKKKF